MGALDRVSGESERAADVRERPPAVFEDESERMPRRHVEEGHIQPTERGEYRDGERSPPGERERSVRAVGFGPPLRRSPPGGLPTRVDPKDPAALAIAHGRVSGIESERSPALEGLAEAKCVTDLVGTLPDPADVSERLFSRRRRREFAALLHFDEQGLEPPDRDSERPRDRGRVVQGSQHEAAGDPVPFDAADPGPPSSWPPVGWPRQDVHRPVRLNRGTRRVEPVGSHRRRRGRGGDPVAEGKHPVHGRRVSRAGPASAR